MNIKGIITTVLSKLQFLDSDQELDLEALLLWIFLGIVAFRAFFANLTLTIGPDIKWIIPDSNIATTLPMLYSLLSNSHRRYLDSKNKNLKGDSTDGQSNQNPTQTGS
jgi:hypothetical protein